MERAISSSEFVNIDLNYIASSVAAIHSSAEDIERHLLNSDFDWREFHDTLDLIFFKIQKNRRQIFKLIAFVKELESALKILSALHTQQNGENQ
jgi:negative regulator of replication initiation